MSTFSADWLSLREPADRAARSTRLAAAAADALGGDGAHVLDLAAGTGANLRALAEQLPMPQQWLLVDHDARLLGCVAGCMASWAATRGYELTRADDDLLVSGPRLVCRLRTTCRDLLGESADLYTGRRLVTASALLDLVSPSWLHALAARCAEHRAVVLFPLSYDGRIACAPADADDDAVRELVNAHQRTDKGFGPACGPEAAAIAQAAFTAAGYEVRSEPSDWILEPDARDLQQQLIEGWADAARAMAPDRAPVIDAWRARRLEHVAAGRSRIVVGHLDVAGWLE